MYCSRSATRFGSLAQEINNMLVYLIQKNMCERKKTKRLASSPFKPLWLTQQVAADSPLKKGAWRHFSVWHRLPAGDHHSMSYPVLRKGDRLHGRCRGASIHDQINVMLVRGILTHTVPHGAPCWNLTGRQLRSLDPPSPLQMWCSYLGQSRRFGIPFHRLRIPIWSHPCHGYVE